MFCIIEVSAIFQKTDISLPVNTERQINQVFKHTYVFTVLSKDTALMTEIRQQIFEQVKIRTTTAVLLEADIQINVVLQINSRELTYIFLIF